MSQTVIGLVEDEIMSLSIDQIKNCDVESVILGSEENCIRYFLSFMQAAKKSRDEQKFHQSRVFNLFGWLCRLTLNSDDHDRPFAELIDLKGHLREQLSNLLNGIYASIEDATLAARVADLAWVLKTKDNYQAAKTAIEKYIKSSQSTYSRNSADDRVRQLIRAAKIAKKLSDKNLTNEMGMMLQRHLDSEDELFDLSVIYKVLSALKELKIKENGFLAEKAAYFAKKIEDSCMRLAALESAATLYMFASKVYENEKNYDLAKKMRIQIACIREKQAEAACHPISGAHFMNMGIKDLEGVKVDTKYKDRFINERLKYTQKAYKDLKKITIDGNSNIAPDERFISSLEGKTPDKIFIILAMSFITLKGPLGHHLKGPSH